MVGQPQEIPGYRHDDMSSTILHDLGFLTRSATHLVSADSDPFFIKLQEVYYLSTSQPNNNDGSSPSIRGARL